MRLRLALVCLALLISCLTAIRATPPEGARQRAATASTPPPLIIQGAFCPYGYFSLVGKHPAGFEKFDTIQYWRKDQEQSGPDISERRSGVTADDGALYRYITVSVSRRKFAFSTARVKGISYGFTGRFLRTDFVNADMDFDKPVLVGKLVKYRNGRKAAEANVKLSYFAGT
ncbi:MAG TPA: hypothetical protein VGX92_20615 [Pyrinomonadaceae bacterium]|nr:hypothetical protein [Pyrinomonadaceae bacterium]